MTPEKKISIITPSFNQAAYVEQTINSVLNQNYSNLEYIIIDGGSTDGSVDIIKKYEKNLSSWESTKDNGQSEAVNKGFKKATGEIISWLNSDDLLAENALSKINEHFKATDAGMIYGKTVLFGDEIKTQIKPLPHDDLTARYLAGMPYSQPSCFFKRQILNEQGALDERLHYAMDYDLFARIALNYEIKQTQDVFSHYRLHKQSKSVRGDLNFAKEWAIVFSRVLRSFSFTDDLINNLKALNLYAEGSEKYNVTKKFTPQDLRKAFLYFLEHQVHNYYNNLDLEKAKQIISFLKTFDPAFYKSRHLETLHYKTSLLNKPLIKLLRLFSRA